MEITDKTVEDIITHAIIITIAIECELQRTKNAYRNRTCQTIITQVETGITYVLLVDTGADISLIK